MRLKNYALFQNGGYIYRNNTSGPGTVEPRSFTEDNRHNLLFEYEANDLTRLHDSLEAHIQKRIDAATLTMTDYEYTESDMAAVARELANLHPYYNHEHNSRADAAIEKVITDYFGYMLFKAGHKDRVVMKNYREILGSSFFPLEGNSALYEIFGAYGPHRHDRVHPFSPSLDDYRQALEEYNKRAGVSVDLTGGGEDPFAFMKSSPPPDEGDYNIEVFKTHDFIKRMLYWSMDTAAPVLREMTVAGRARLFMRMFVCPYLKDFDGDIEQYLIKANKLLFFDAFAWYDQPLAHKEDLDLARAIDDFRHSADQSLLNYHLAPGDLPDHAKDALTNMANHVKALHGDTALEAYEITDLRQLLFLEILFMADMGTGIKRCKHCRTYFVPANLNAEYCGRIDENGKACSVVGPKHAYKSKLKADDPQADHALIKYTRAYRTRHARVNSKNPKMSKSEFSTWGDDARKKLEEVRNGTLTVEEFDVWLKK